jgi:FtsH-binding integral membrane protein
MPQDSMAIAQENARFMSRVYAWMTAGIGLTFWVAYAVSTEEGLVYEIFGNPLLRWGLIIAQLGAVFFLARALQKLSATVCIAIYLLYAALTGLTFSGIFIAYTDSSIASVFGVTALSFAGLSGFGYITKKDLGPIGSFCMMGLFGMLGIALLSIFFPGMLGETSQMAIAACGVLVFAGLTAYDTQKIKAMNIIGNEGTEEDTKEAIYGALQLYLDFINLFLQILRLMGRRR